MPEDIPVYKVSILGDGAVGKTSLIRRYCEGRFEHSRVMTIGVDFQTKVVQVGERAIKLSIWDVAGQPRFKSMRESFYKGSLAAALVYDLTVDESLMNLDGWYLELKKTAQQARIIVVGNKLDLAPEKTIAGGQAFARKIGAGFLTTSALNGQGVAQLFEGLARLACYLPVIHYHTPDPNRLKGNQLPQ
jgi:small GTP-binding protein